MSAMAWPDVEHSRLVRLCATISGDPGAAEDLAQETLLEAWRQRHKLTDPNGADRWLAAIARNVCLRWGRARGRLPLPVAELPEREAPPEDRVVELLELLPDSARDVLLQRYVYERSHGEIAAALGISGDAVAMRLTRGKQTLRRLLAEAEWRPCGIACPHCATRKLLMRRCAEEIAFTCPACEPDGILIRYPLGNPQFARLVAELERPTAMIRRVGDWISRYFAAGDGARVDCTRCGARATVHAERGDRTGLFVRCSACGEEVWSALSGLAFAQPAVRELRARRLVAVREERGAVEVVHASDDGRTVTVGFDRATFVLLG